MGTFDLQVAKHLVKVQAPNHYCERQIKLKIIVNVAVKQINVIVIQLGKGVCCEE